MNPPEDKQTISSSGSVLAKTLGFSIALTLVFTLVANLLPQVEGEAFEEKEIDLGALTVDTFVAMGEEIFKGKGTCTLCHNAMGRAPDILAFNMMGAADERLQDERYKGSAPDAAAYIRESMVDPGIYVVKGFGKKGSNDTESPMPSVDKPPIQLSEVEMDAVIAFLQSKDGNDVTVELPSADAAPVVVADAAAGSAPKSAETAEEAIGKYGCQACHNLLGTESPVGPSLEDASARMSAMQIRESILKPDAVIAEGFTAGMMPGDFDSRMTVKELEMIVQFLAEKKG